VEVGPGEEERALAVLAVHGPGARRDGAVLRAPLADEATVPAVVAALVRAGLAVHGASRRRPSLEEVYFALAGREAPR
jgi:hypothetical protein